MNLNWNLVQVFVDVVEAGSLSEAARRRGVTRSSISQALKRLEKDLESQLLRRTTRNLEPTEAGITLYEHGVRMAREIDQASASLLGLGHTLTGSLRVAVPPALGERYLGNELARFGQAHPQLALRVLFSNRIDDLVSAGIDVALKVTSMPPLELVARELCALTWRCYASPAYLRAHGRPDLPQALASHRLLSPREDLRIALEFTSRAGGNVQVQARPHVASERLTFLLECALAGMGITILPHYMVADALRAGMLEEILPDWSTRQFGSHLYLLTVPNRFPTPAARALIEAVRAWMQEIVGTEHA